MTSRVMVAVARALACAVFAAALVVVLAGCGQTAADAVVTPMASTPTTTAPTPTATAQPSASIEPTASVPRRSLRCFGAASRSLGFPCHASELRFAVMPSLAVAAATPNAPCTATQTEGPLYLCSFGVPQAQATRTIALIGDSHAAMWRAALAPIAVAEGWHGISIVHPGCPFSALTRQIGGPARDQSCATWRRAIVPWLDRNPQVSAMFVGGLSASPFIHPAGEPNFQAAYSAYRQIWAQVPKTVQHIVVMHDTPLFGAGNLACIAGAVAAHADAGTACAVARKIALLPDPEAAAAASMHSARFQLINVNHEICGTQLCYPVVGGVLVLKDLTHLTRMFATTLTPAVRAQVTERIKTWGPPKLK